MTIKHCYSNAVTATFYGCHCYCHTVAVFAVQRNLFSSPPSKGWRSVKHPSCNLDIQDSSFLLIVGGQNIGDGVLFAHNIVLYEMYLVFLYPAKGLRCLLVFLSTDILGILVFLYLVYIYVLLLWLQINRFYFIILYSMTSSFICTICRNEQ